MVMIKLGVLVFLVVLVLRGFDSSNLSGIVPSSGDEINDVTTAAGIIFFSYIGLDAVSTAGEEVKNPRRTMPLAFLTALIVVTSLYILVSAAASKIVRHSPVPVIVLPRA